MQLDYSTLIDVLLWALLFGVILYLLYFKYIYSVLDPLCTYVYTTAFASVLVLYVLQNDKYIVHYFVCQFCLFLGFYIQTKVSLRRKIDVFYYYDAKLLEKTLYILSFIYFLSNLFTLFTRGSAFFSDDPYARETNFQEGFGIFRRINWGVGSFLTAGLTILFLKERKRLYLYMIFFISVFTMLEGTKSSLLRIVIIISALVYHPHSKRSYSVVEKFKKYTPIGIIVLLFAFFTVLIKESKGDYDILLSFVNRLLAGADSVLYFYLPQNEYLQSYYHPLDFVSYVVNPITGFLHVTPYVEPFGSVTVGNTREGLLKTDVYLAPNTPFYIEGQIFFGYYGAFMYSFSIGYIIASIRNIFFGLSKGSYFTLALLCTFFYHSLALPVETSLFIKSCLDTILFAIPTYVGVSLIYTKKIVLRRLSA